MVACAFNDPVWGWPDLYKEKPYQKWGRGDKKNYLVYRSKAEEPWYIRVIKKMEISSFKCGKLKRWFSGYMHLLLPAEQLNLCLSFQHTHGSSQPSVTPVLGEPTLSSCLHGFLQACSTHIYTQAHTCTKKLFKMSLYINRHFPNPFIPMLI